MAMENHHVYLLRDTSYIFKYCFFPLFIFEVVNIYRQYAALKLSLVPCTCHRWNWPKQRVDRKSTGSSNKGSTNMVKMFPVFPVWGYPLISLAAAFFRPHFQGAGGRVLPSLPVSGRVKRVQTRRKHPPLQCHVSPQEMAGGHLPNQYSP